MMNTLCVVCACKTCLAVPNKRHLLEPLRFRLTNGFVLSESLLEKLERRLAWVSDCCLRLSSGWPREGCKKMETNKIDKKRELKLAQWFIICRPLGRAFVGGSGERYVFKCVSAGLRTRFTSCKKMLRPSAFLSPVIAAFCSFIYVQRSQTTTTCNNDHQPF